VLLIKNGNVYLGNGDLKPNRDILIEDGCIKAVEEGIDSSKAKTVIDAAGKYVYPGFVLALSAVGAVNFADGFRNWDNNETSNPITPQMDVRHAFDLKELNLQRFTRAGITSYGLSPGTNNLLAGQMSFISSAGCKRGDVFLSEKMALKGNFTKTVKTVYGEGKSVSPKTRMAMFQMMDEAFRSASEYIEKQNSDKAPDYDEGKEVLARVLKREIPFIVNANTRSEIESMIALGDKHKLEMVICGAFAVENCWEEIVKRNWHVILGDLTFDTIGIDNKTNLSNLTALYRKGLKLSISCSGDMGYPPAYEQLLWIAALMHQAGATGDEIIDMMSINPARALRMEKLVGSITAGKRADIILCNGNPATRFDNIVERTFIGGIERYKREGV